MRRTFLFAPLLLVACALDPVGQRDDDLTAATGTQTGAGVGTGSTGLGSSGAGAGPSVGGGAPTSGQGGDGASSQGGSNQGGSNQGGSNQGGSNQGGANQGGGGDGGSGGDGGTATSSGTGGSGGAGQGGQGGGEAGGGGAGQGGGGGAACGNGTIEPPEECDGPDPECDPLTCTLRGACDVDQPISFQPGGLSFSADTTNTPSTTAFGTCAETDDAPTHLYTYTTGPVPAYVQVIVDSDIIGLADPVLSMHASCFDETITTCFTGSATPPCCSDEPLLQDESLLTNLVQPGTVLTVAVSGFEGDDGRYDIAFRDLRYLFLELFEPAPGQFSSSLAWIAIAGQGCAGGSLCMRYDDVGDNTAGDAMTSAPFAAPGIGAATLAWHQQIDENIINLVDTYRVEVSTDGGVGWTEVYRYAGIVLEEADPQVAIDFIAGEDDVRVRFVAQADLGNTGRWYVDNVQVIGW